MVRTHSDPYHDLSSPHLAFSPVDIFVNCIYLTEKIPYFVTNAAVNGAGPSRRLGVIVDVSCDTTNPHNPIPVYNTLSYFNNPIVKAQTEYVAHSTYPECSCAILSHPDLYFYIHSDGLPPLHVIAIDHLPTLLPREASEQFSSDLLPSLLTLPERSTARVWTEAEELFKKKVLEARKWLKENPQ